MFLILAQLNPVFLAICSQRTLTKTDLAIPTLAAAIKAIEATIESVEILNKASFSCSEISTNLSKHFDKHLACSVERWASSPVWTSATFINKSSLDFPGVFLGVLDETVVDSFPLKKKFLDSTGDSAESSETGLVLSSRNSDMLNLKADPFWLGVYTGELLAVVSSDLTLLETLVGTGKDPFLSLFIISPFFLQMNDKTRVFLFLYNALANSDWFSEATTGVLTCSQFIVV